MGASWKTLDRLMKNSTESTARIRIKLAIRSIIIGLTRIILTVLSFLRIKNQSMSEWVKASTATRGRLTSTSTSVCASCQAPPEAPRLPTIWALLRQESPRHPVAVSAPPNYST